MTDTLIARDKTRQIPLTKGYSAIVDAEDYECLMQWRWHAIPRVGIPYTPIGPSQSLLSSKPL